MQHASLSRNPSITFLLITFHQSLGLPLSSEASTVHCSNVMRMCGLPGKENNWARHAICISAFLESATSNAGSPQHVKRAF